jgi:hypothetical protein
MESVPQSILWGETIDRDLLRVVIRRAMIAGKPRARLQSRPRHRESANDRGGTGTLYFSTEKRVTLERKAQGSIVHLPPNF